MPPGHHAIILGAGVTGLAAALSLSSTFPSLPFTVYELRLSPSALGGAVGLSPPALRYLDRLGALEKLKEKNLGCVVDEIEIYSIHSGRRLGEIDFKGAKVERGYRSRRVMRRDLLEGMMGVLQERIERTGVGKMAFGRKVVEVVEGGEEVEVRFEDGGVDRADLVLGCDGIHSVARTSFVEPERKPVYSGIAAAYAFARLEAMGQKLHFATTSLNSGRQGSLLMSFCDGERKTMFVGAVMEKEEQFSREGWKAKGEDQEVIKKDILRRFQGGVFPVVQECIEKTEDWFLYPVYKLRPKGRWCKGKVMLLGDAAHAMPPQGESVGLALEDVVLFTRILSHYSGKTTQEVFQIYETARRSRIDEAYEEATYRWETVKDAGWLGNWLKELFTPWYLWWTRDKRAESFRMDVGNISLPA